MPGIYDQQIDQVKQRSQQQNAQNNDAMQRRMAQMGGGPGGAAEKLQLQSQNQVQQNQENTITGINANQQQEQAGVNRENAARDFEGQQAGLSRNQQNEQFGKTLGFQQSQAQFGNQMAEKQFADNKLGREHQEAFQSAQLKNKIDQQNEDNNFFSGKNLGGMARGLIGGGAAALLSDENAKENIKDSDKEIGEFLDGVNPVSYDYKDQANGAGTQYGIIAQDLEKHPVGKSFVIETSKGKMVDFAKGHAVVLAAQSSLHRRLKQLEGRES